MISPTMFQEFVIPALESEANDAAAFVYHLDGPGAIPHLEALCDMARLDLISWVPGAGNEDKNWDPLYEKIDRLGKGHSRYLADHAEIKRIWRTYRSRKLFFTTTAASKSEAEDFIAALEGLEKETAE